MIYTLILTKDFIFVKDLSVVNLLVSDNNPLTHVGSRMKK